MEDCGLNRVKIEPETQFNIPINVSIYISVVLSLEKMFSEQTDPSKYTNIFV